MQSQPVSAKIHAAAFVLIAIAVFGVFGQTLNDGYNVFDDREYILGNEIVLKGITTEGLRYAFTNTVVSHWNPVTVLSHMVMVQIFGSEPAPHHAANIAIHLLSAFLVYWILFRTTREVWPALLAALIFAVHPLRAETVAWIAERKGLLCGFFGIVTVWAYIGYARKPAVWRYLLVSLAFALSLMSKGALLTLPIALMVLDYWPLGRISRERSRWMLLAAEKLPLMALSVASAAITVKVTSSQHVMVSSEAYPLYVRVANAARSCFMYLANTIVPVGVAPQYPHPGHAVFGPVLYIGLTVLVMITALSVVYWKRAPWLLTGWFWYLITLAPLSGIIQVASQGRADRYTYVPQIGLCIVVAWGMAAIVNRFPRLSKPSIAIAAAVLLALAITGFWQTSFWRDTYTLFSRGVAINPESGMVHFGLGVAQYKRGEAEAAERSFHKSVELGPPLPSAFGNLGNFEYLRGNFPQACAYYSRALELDPDNPQLMINLGTALLRRGQVAEAKRLAEAALSLKPEDPRARALKYTAETGVEPVPAPAAPSPAPTP